MGKKSENDQPTYCVSLDHTIVTHNTKLYNMYNYLKINGKLSSVIYYLLENLAMGNICIIDPNAPTMEQKMDTVYTVLEKLSNISNATATSLNDTSNTLGRTAQFLIEMRSNILSLNTDIADIKERLNLLAEVADNKDKPLVQQQEELTQEIKNALSE